MKIHIFGASGSGVTTLGNQLSQKLGIPYLDSDDFFWHDTVVPFTERRDAEIRNKMISEEMNRNDNFILGGSIIHWGEKIFPEFDLIVFLYLPPAVRMERLRSREIMRYGNEIISNPEREKQYKKFIAWAEDYDIMAGIAQRNLRAHEEWLSYQNKSKVLELRGDLDKSVRLKLILERVLNME